jgi:hypothetical protein
MEEDFSEAYNLLELQNGITRDVVRMEMPVGSYDLVRLHVDTANIKSGRRAMPTSVA